MKQITNQQIKLVKKLHQKKFRDEHGLFFVEGEKGVQEAIHANENIIFLILSDEKLVSQFDVTEEKILIISELNGKKISSVKTWPKVMAIIQKKKIDFSSFKNANTIVALYQINDPGNLGTIIRTCHWFGIKHVLIGEGSVDVYNEKVVRASMGSFFHVHILESANFFKDLQRLKNQKFTLIALDIKGKQHQILHKKKTILLFGNESQGLSDECISIADQVIAISGKEKTANSLNVAVSVGITLHSFS